MAQIKQVWMALALAGVITAAGPALAQQPSPELRGAPEDEWPPLQPPLPQPLTQPQSVPVAPGGAQPAPRPVPPVIPPAPRFESVRPAERVITPPPAVAAMPIPPRPPVSQQAPAAPATAAVIPPRPPQSQRAQQAAASPVPMLVPPRTPTVFASSVAGFERLTLVGAPGALCVSVRGGLGPALEIGGRPAVLAPCGAGAVAVRLVDGVLYVGEDRSHHLTPMVAPSAGCRLVDTISQVRRTLVGVCLDSAARQGAFEEDLRAPGWGRIAAQTASPGPAYTPGAPLMAAPVAPETPPVPAWTLSPSLEQIATADGTLCFTTPAGDRTAGAPLILKPCGPAAARFSFQAR